VPTAEDVGAPVDVEEYRFADRHTAARAWTIAAALTARHPDLLVNSVVGDDGAAQLVVHDAAEQLTVQLDRVAGVVFHQPNGRVDHLPWDQVFASTTARIVRRLEHGSALRPWAGSVRLPDVAQRSAPICHEAIATVLRANVDTAHSWTVRQVRCGPHEEQVETGLIARFDPERMLGDAVRDYFERCVAHGWWYSPVWELSRDLEPVCLVETDTGRAFLPDGDRVGLRTFGPGHRVVAELTRAITRSLGDR
jgi:hypothetical protein